MKQLIIIVFFIKVSLISGLCTCEEFLESDCQNQFFDSVCFWDGIQCRQKQCTDIQIKENCNQLLYSYSLSFLLFKEEINQVINKGGEDIFQCYWNGYTCEKFQSCSAIILKDFSQQQFCYQYGCQATGQQCEELQYKQCGDITNDALCGQIYLNRNNCQWDGQFCVEYDNSGECSKRNLLNCLENSNCKMTKKYQCVTRQCSEITDSEICFQTKIEDNLCHYKNGSCTNVNLIDACSNQNDQKICSYLTHCIWRNNQCVGKQCGDIHCIDTFARGYRGGDDVQQLIFCKGDGNGQCITATSCDLTIDQCGVTTDYLYTWSNLQYCKKCLNSSFDFILLTINAALLIF